jgi:hypothetical protein
MKRNLLIVVIVIITLAGLYFWRSGGSNVSLSGSLTAELGQAQTYQATEDNFTFVYPEKLKITEIPIDGVEGGKRILAESGEAKKGFEVVILPFDENGVLTKERILQDVPDMVIKNEKKVTVGGNIEAIQFEGEDESIGATSEIWFTHSGHIYEARTYPEFGAGMAEILTHWKFK